MTKQKQKALHSRRLDYLVFAILDFGAGATVEDYAAEYSPQPKGFMDHEPCTPERLRAAAKVLLDIADAMPEAKGGRST